MVYRALRARRELGREKGWWKWKRQVAARAVAEQAKRMRAWRENGSLSGLPLAAVGRKVVVEVERRSRVSVARRERWVQEHVGKREMRDGRWAVARVVEARRTKTGGVLALVEWKGVDPVSGVAWENSWVSLRDLSVAARPEAKALLPARARRACWEEVADEGAGDGMTVSGRRSGRLAAERVARAAPGVCYRALLVEAYAAIRSGEEEPPEGLTVERARLVLRWLSRAYATQVGGVAFAARMTEGQAEARWEALPARFDWTVKAAEDRAAAGEAEVGLVGEEARESGQAVREDGAVEGVWEVGMSAVAEVKERRTGPGGVEVLVAWEGVDAATGLGWPDSWIPEAWLSGDLRRRQRRRRRAGPTKEVKKAEKRAREAEERAAKARLEAVQAARRRAAGTARSERAGARRGSAPSELGDVASGGDAASAGGGDTEGAPAGIQGRARVRSGVAVGSPKGSVRKTRKRGSPSKPAGASRVRGGAAVGSPTGGLRKTAKDGEGESDRSPNRGADVASVVQRLRSRRLFNGGRDGAPT